MKDIEKIATEAAHKIAGWKQSDDDPWVLKVTAIIKAAIEKATTEQQERYDALLLAHIQGKVNAVKAAQASEKGDKL